MTIFVGVLAGVFLPYSIETASFLTPEERLFAAQRLKADRPAGSEEEFSWKAVRRAVFSIQVSPASLPFTLHSSEEGSSNANVDRLLADLAVRSRLLRHSMRPLLFRAFRAYHCQ
jgi:hypothetical protein